MGYSYQGDMTKAARAMAREEDVSRKLAREACNAIKGMKLERAIQYLENVIQHKEYIPLKRYNRKQPHRKGGQPGKYPEKACRILLKTLKNLKNNAEQKNLDPEKMKIVHAAAYKGLEIPRVRPRGRTKASNIELTNIEVVAREV